MANEIEHKYLVSKDKWTPSGPGTLYRQGYLSSVKERVVRVRIVGASGFLTVKGLTAGITRSEFEYEIPLEDAKIMLDQLCERPLIEKTRYVEEFAGRRWEIDEFAGDNEGLLVAEIELKRADDQFDLPPWIGREVSSNPCYFNSNLVSNPYSKWRQR